MDSDVTPRDPMVLAGRDVGRALYAILLGREVETAQRLDDISGVPAPALAASITEAQEFQDRLDALERDGRLPAPRVRLSAAQRAEAEAFLRDFAAPLPDDAEGPEAWLLALLSAPALAPLLAERPALEDARAALAEAAHHREAEAGRRAAFFAPLAPPRLPASPDPAPMERVAAAFPFFPVARPEAGEPPSRPERWPDWVRRAAEAGHLAHWLWHEHTYRAQAADFPEPLGEQPPFLHFLLHGDAAGLSPHPLFSPAAYRQLNKLRPARGEGAFRHWVLEGEAEERPTTCLFDRAYYLERNPQVRAQLAAGSFRTALEHFIRHGLAAGLDFLPDFDAAFYLERNPDIREAVASGYFPSAAHHFLFFGVAEGRDPNRYFSNQRYAQRYPDSGEEMRRLGLRSVFEHFLLLGRARGWRPGEPRLNIRADLDGAKALLEQRGRRAFLEAMDGTLDSLREAPREPALSVVVPVSGQADFTAGFLKWAGFAADHLAFRRGLGTEVIVVDNGSDDHTASLLAAMPGVRHLRFDAPIGFPAAVNRGVEASSGRIVLVANNDIEFAPNAFARAVDALDADPTLGLVGAKILLPNETLQEAGSLLRRDGSSLGLGRGLPATDGRGARLVEVDYASGCFIAFRREDFAALGGFDEGYSPGYYEEVDFALRLKGRLGKRSALDTGLAVVHHEHASFAKGRPQAAAEALMLRNRRRFRGAHAAALAALPPASPRHVAARLREAVWGARRLLVVEDRVPSALLGAGFGRMEEICHVLSELGVGFDILALNPSPLREEWPDPLTRVFRQWLPGEGLDAVLERSAGLYTHLWLCRTHNLHRAAAAVAGARAGHELTVICDTEAVASRRAIEQAAMRGRPMAAEEQAALFAAELADPLGVDHWVAVTAGDAALMRGLGLGPVHEVGHHVRVPAGGAARPFAARGRILFVGALYAAGSPNHDGVEWFARELMPRLPAEARRAVTIAGHWKPELREAFEADFPGFEGEILGSVTEAELAALYAEARVSLAPTRFSAGVPCKVVESVLHGVPTVMTDLLAGQLDVPGLAGLAAAPRQGPGFAEWVARLWTDEAAWQAQRELQAASIGAANARERFVSAIAGVCRASALIT